MLRRMNVDPWIWALCATIAHRLNVRYGRLRRNADVVISSGGVSVGDADFTRDLMNAFGDVAFWKIAMRPGRPLAFGRLWSGKRPGEGESALFFGLPGNPVAVMATFYFIVREALLRHVGRDAASAAVDLGDKHRKRSASAPGAPSSSAVSRTATRAAAGVSRQPARKARRAEFDERSQLLHRAQARSGQY